MMFNIAPANYIRYSNEFQNYDEYFNASLELFGNNWAIVECNDNTVTKNASVNWRFVIDIPTFSYMPAPRIQQTIWKCSY